MSNADGRRPPVRPPVPRLHLQNLNLNIEDPANQTTDMGTRQTAFSPSTTLTTSPREEELYAGRYRVEPASPIFPSSQAARGDALSFQDQTSPRTPASAQPDAPPLRVPARPDAQPDVPPSSATAATPESSAQRNQRIRDGQDDMPAARPRLDLRALFHAFAARGSMTGLVLAVVLSVVLLRLCGRDGHGATSHCGRPGTDTSPRRHSWWLCDIAAGLLRLTGTLGPTEPADL